MSKLLGFDVVPGRYANTIVEQQLKKSDANTFFKNSCWYNNT